MGGVVMGESRSKSANSSEHKSEEDKNVRILSRPISTEHLLNAQRKSFWPYLCLVVALILLLVVGYFAWFFQNQNLLLQERFDNIQNQVNLDYKKHITSSVALKQELNKQVNSVISQVDIVNKQNVNLKSLVLSNQQAIQKQQKLLSSPGNSISMIKNNAKQLMLGSLVQNVKQAVLMNQVALASQLWFDNSNFLIKNFKNLAPNLNRVNNDFSNLVITNEPMLISNLSKLAGSRDQLEIVDINARYQSLKKSSVDKNKKLVTLKSNKANEDSSWWERQKVSSKKYLSDIWSHIKSSVVVSNNKSEAPLLITQGDRVDAYRIVVQYLMQMQWGVVSGDYKLFNQTKFELSSFVEKNMIENPKRNSWLKRLGALSLPDQESKVKSLIISLNDLTDKASVVYFKDGVTGEYKNNSSGHSVGEHA
jgi:hypothetical protein